MERIRIGPIEVPTSQALGFNSYADLDLVGIYLSNTTAGDLTIEFWIKPAPAVEILDSHKFLGDVTILANDMRNFSDAIEIPLAPDDKIYWQASGAGLNIITVFKDSRS